MGMIISTHPHNSYIYLGYALNTSVLETETKTGIKVVVKRVNFSSYSSSPF